MSETKPAPVSIPPHAFGDERAWPPLLKTADAARYCGYENAWGLLKANERGKVFPAGRRGGTGTYMWRREDLDRFLRGEQPTNAPPSIDRRRRDRRSEWDHDPVAAALARIRSMRDARRGSR